MGTNGGRSLRGLLAHLATPWAWRSRFAVQTLVVLCVAISVASVVWPFTGDMDGGAAFVTALVFGPLFAGLFGWPAVRSWRRWRRLHADA